MALIFCESFDRYGTSGNVKTEFGRLWTISNGDNLEVTAVTGRTGTGVTLADMASMATCSRSFTASGTKLIITVAINLTSGCSGRIAFGSNSYIEVSDDELTVTYGGTAGNAHVLTQNTWHVVELVLDSASGASQRCYCNGRLLDGELRTIAPGTGSAITLSASSTGPGIDDLIVCDGSGTAGNKRLGPNAKVVLLKPSSTVSNSFGAIAGQASAHLVLDNVPPLDGEYVSSSADSQSVRCDLANPGGTVTVIAGVQVSTIVANRDDTGQGLTLTTNWASGAASTHTATPAETLTTVSKSYSTRGDGTAISAADLDALSLALTQT